jgi:hypothetical protein
MFVCNGIDKIWRIQKALSAEMLNTPIDYPTAMS